MTDKQMSLYGDDLTVALLKLIRILRGRFKKESGTPRNIFYFFLYRRNRTLTNLIIALLGPVFCYAESEIMLSRTEFMVHNSAKLHLNTVIGIRLRRGVFVLCQFFFNIRVRKKLGP